MHSTLDLIMPHSINLCLYYACYAQPSIASCKDNTNIVLAFLDSSFPLAKCTGLEVDGTFESFKFAVVDEGFESEDTLDMVRDLVETPLEDIVICLCMRTF